MVRQRDYECQPQDSGSEHSSPHFCELDFETDYETDGQSEQEYQQDPLFIARMPNMEESKSIRSVKIPFSTYKENIREYLSQITERQQIKILWGVVVVLLILLCWSFISTPSQSPNSDLAYENAHFSEEACELHDHGQHGYESHFSNLEPQRILSEPTSSLFDREEEPDLVLPTTSIEIADSTIESDFENTVESDQIRTASTHSVWNREPQNTSELQTTWNNTSPSNAYAPNSGTSAISMDDGADFAALSQQWNSSDVNNTGTSQNDSTAFQSVGPPPQFSVNSPNSGRYQQAPVQNTQQNTLQSAQQNRQQNVMGQNSNPAYSNAAGFNGQNSAYNPIPQQTAPQGSGMYNTNPNAYTGARTTAQQPYAVQGNNVPNNMPNNVPNNAPNNTTGYVPSNATPYYNHGAGYTQPQGVQGANTSPYNVVNHREEIPANPTNNTYRNVGTPAYGTNQPGPYATDTLNQTANGYQTEQQRLATNANSGARDGSYSGNNTAGNTTAGNTVQNPQPTYQQQLNQQNYGNTPSYNNPQYDNSQRFTY